MGRRQYVHQMGGGRYIRLAKNSPQRASLPCLGPALPVPMVCFVDFFCLVIRALLVHPHLFRSHPYLLAHSRPAHGEKVEVMSLDLASLASIDSFAKRYSSSVDQLDILVNNAGVMAIPERQTTADGFERQFGVNHLGEPPLPLCSPSSNPRTQFYGVRSISCVL